MNNHNKSTEELQNDLNKKINDLYSDKKLFIDYILNTKSNFLYRYLETSTDKDIKIQMPKLNYFKAESFEQNMGIAFKTENIIVKEAVKNLAKTVDRSLNPKVKYSLITEILESNEDSGKILITSSINWGFPDFNDNSNIEKKVVSFQYSDLNQFRKELALKYEEACELFS